MYSKCPLIEHVHASERLLRTRPTFSETVMVSVRVSKLGCTELFFCRAVGKNKQCLLQRLAAHAEVIASVYYSDLLLTQKLLPVTRQIAGNEFVFHQDCAPAHCARETIELLR